MRDGPTTPAAAGGAIGSGVRTTGAGGAVPLAAERVARVGGPAGASRPRVATLGHVAVALPETVVASDAVAARLGVAPGWIEARTGIEARRVLGAGETLAGLAARAAQHALASAGVAAASVDLVLVATSTPDEPLPNAAPLVAGAIGATRAGALDVGAACTGFMGALALAAAQVESGRARTVLCVGADVLSRYTDPGDRRTAALFGDGAGAALVTAAAPGAPGRIGPVVLGADAAGAGLLRLTRERGVVEMDGQAVFRHAVTRMAQATVAACEAAEATLADIDLFVYHQANRRILLAVGRRLGLDPARVVDSIAAHGNTSAASIPIALDAARADGRLRPGTRVLLAAFGAGFTWGGAVVEWGSGA